jgi:acylphosphatase
VNSDQLFELSAQVKGNVQGVGFRAAVKSCAARLELTGYVRNLSNGDVEICAQGKKVQLEKLLSQLKQEFSRSIEEIHCDFHLPINAYPNFKIIR